MAYMAFCAAPAKAPSVCQSQLGRAPVVQHILRTFSDPCLRGIRLGMVFPHVYIGLECLLRVLLNRLTAPLPGILRTVQHMLHQKRAEINLRRFWGDHTHNILIVRVNTLVRRFCDFNLPEMPKYKDKGYEEMEVQA